MSMVLVVDDMAVFREPIALALRQRGFQAQTAEDGLDALNKLNAQRPDVILLDLAMPRMDGLSLLRHIRGQGQFQDIPVILLTAIGDRTKIMDAGQLGVRDYLLKSRFSIDDLCARLGKYATPAVAVARPVQPVEPSDEKVQVSPAPTSVRHDTTPTDPTEALRAIKPILSRSEIYERIEKADELKAMSPVVGQLLKLTGSVNCSIHQVANIIRQDQAIALKVLKLANSVVYARGEHVESVQQAIGRIGLTQIREVALNISVMNRFADSKIASVLDSNDFWEHSIATGLIAAQIVRFRNGNDTDANAAFTMGLLHDVGRMVFIEQFADEYLEVMKTADRLQLPLEVVESRMLLVNHADLMDRLLHQWKFSKALVDPIALHHLSLSNARGLAPRTVNEVAVLSLANCMAHAMLLGTSGSNTIHSVSALIEFLKLRDDQMCELEKGIGEEVSDMKFTMLTNAEDARRTPDLRLRIGKLFTSPLRPLYVSCQTGFDAYRAFTTALAEPGDERPNVAIVYVNAPSEREQLTGRLREAEKQVGVAGVPTIMLSHKGNIALEDNAMRGRRCELLPTPTPVLQFIHAVNRAANPLAEGTAA